MGAFKLFISHSSKTNENREFRDKICSAITNSNNNIEILVDTKLHLGDEWFPEINEWMMECHAAIILMSDAALNDSDWVKNEAAVLCARRRANNNFKLITIPIDSVTPGCISDDAFYGGVIRLPDFQLVKDCADDSERLEKTTQYFNDLVHADTPFENLVKHIKKILKQFQGDTLSDAWDSMAEAKSYWKKGISYEDSLARSLIRNSDNVLTDLYELIENLNPDINTKQAEDFVKTLQGLWVHTQAAALLELSGNNNQVSAINCREFEDFICRSYARRIWPNPKMFKIINVGDSRTFSDVEPIILNTLARSITNKRTQQRRAKTYRHPVILLFPFLDQDGHETTLPENTILSEIKDEYQNITILLATGTDIPQYLTDVTRLEPLLNHDKVETQYNAFLDIHDYIEENITA